jgi:ABC-type transport system substrate-binding protein
MKRRSLLQAASAVGASVLSAAHAAPPAGAAGPAKVFRWAFNFAESGFDPAQISDLASSYVVASIFESPLQYDYLARPAQIRARTAARMPDVSGDFRRFTVTIQPGIRFQDDPVFGGKPRELTAADHVYQLKRLADPRWKSPLWSSLESQQIIGLTALRQQALETKKFDYDREIEGLRALDRYTFEVRLAEPSPRFAALLADPRYSGAVVREVVEAYADTIMGKPVGTGPFRLASWTRASRIVLERNPNFRDELYEASAPAGDADAQTFALRLRGRKLPLVDRVELSIIDESQPRWLAFLNGEQDAVNVPLEFVNQALPGGQVAPALARRGIRVNKLINPDVVITLFNLDDPVVGGYTPERVALRRAIGLAYNIDEEIRMLRRGTMMPAQSQVPPQTDGYDPGFVSDMGRFDLARARALLDTYGYVDRDGDGWREQPDGAPLTLEMATESSQLDRAFNEMWKRQMDRLGVRMQFKAAQWPDNQRSARTGKLMMWTLGNTASAPDSDGHLSLAVGRETGNQNLSRFNRPEYDALYDRQRRLPNGPERDAVIRELKRLWVTWMPYKVHGHRFVNDLTHPWLVGFRRHPFARDWFKYVDVDDSQRAGHHA